MLICETDKLGKTEWDIFCEKTGVSREENEEFRKITQAIMHPHRHGKHIFFTKKQHLKMMHLTRLLSAKAIKFILQSKATCTPPPQQPIPTDLADSV
jgi:adenylate cyclase